MNWVFLFAFIGILGALAGAGYFMLKRGNKQPNAMARALALRVALSISLFLFIWLAYSLGWIEPRGLPINR
jgi:hypothetical protein